MGKRKSNSIATYQGQLFSSPQKQYEWQPVLIARKGMTMVVMSEDVKVLDVRQDEDCVYLAYTDPESGKKTEQLYSHTDSIYVKL